MARRFGCDCEACLRAADDARPGTNVLSESTSVSVSEAEDEDDESEGRERWTACRLRDRECEVEPEERPGVICADPFGLVEPVVWLLETDR